MTNNIQEPTNKLPKTSPSLDFSLVPQRSILSRINANLFDYSILVTVVFMFVLFIVLMLGKWGIGLLISYPFFAWWVYAESKKAYRQYVEKFQKFAASNNFTYQAKNETISEAIDRR